MTSPENIPNNERSIDLSYLKQLSNGSNKFILEIIDVFLKQTPEALESMENYLNNKDWKSLRAVAHKIKPSMTFMGINDLKDVVGKIEEYADKEINLDLLPELIHKMQDVCKKAFLELEAEKNNFV
jgi:HPt (histidine-containing phosphotransfer) domain-containing protein